MTRNILDIPFMGFFEFYKIIFDWNLRGQLMVFQMSQH